MAHVKNRSVLKHFLAAALATTFALAAPVQAKSAECTAQWSAFVDTLQGAGLPGMPSAALVRTLADGQCRVGAITIPVDSEAALSVQSVTWGGEDMVRFVNDALPPRALTVAIKGLVLQPAAGKTRFRKKADRYLSTLTGDVNVSASWDEDARTVIFDNLSLRLPQGDYVIAQATIENMDLSSKANMQMSLGGFLISKVGITFATVGTFEPYLDARFGPMPVEGAAFAAMVDEDVDKLPAFLMTQDSKQALKALLVDFPKSTEEARLDVNATPGWGPLKYLRYVLARKSRSKEKVFATLEGVQVDVIYPTP